VDTLLNFIRVEVQVLVVGLALAVFYRLLVAGVRARGLLSTPEGTLSVSAIQFLLVSAGGALYVLTRITSDPGILAVPDGYLYLLGGSGFAHLASRTRLSARLRRFLADEARTLDKEQLS
jgi:hypothetical protein